MVGDDRVKLLQGGGHFEGRPSMIGLGGVRLGRMGLRWGVRLEALRFNRATIENYDM